MIRLCRVSQTFRTHTGDVQALRDVSLEVAESADLVDLGRSLQALWWQTLRKIRMPAAVPQLFVGLMVAITLAVIAW